jgi:hypothetical protein
MRGLDDSLTCHNTFLNKREKRKEDLAKILARQLISLSWRRQSRRTARPVSPL